MKKTFAGVTALSLLLIPSFVAAQTPITLTVHADQPVSAVSSTLYGLMTEEINYSYDGGLYAEMVRNRTFEGDWSGILHWILIEDGNARAKMAPDKSTGPSDALKSSLRLDVAQAGPHSHAGLLNDGWWGMSLRPNTVYKGSLYAKTDTHDLGPITVSLIANQTGKVLASAEISGIASAWQQHQFKLKTGDIAASSTNHLEITVAHPGSLWLNLVSLFPPTYHDRANGNRIDLMEKMAAMHPAFLRFPGGNYLEGDHINERYDWKKTIGPLVDRPTHPSPWGYHSSDGLGLLEFLEWCEDLKMQPVLAVYAGYSMHQEHVDPGPALDPYVQDALDEIEYVTGGADTKWGSERIKDGHPAPFPLHYVEIGNEDWFDKSGSYDGRYIQYYKAIKAKYPGLQLIATAPVSTVKPDVLDEHYYVRAAQNFQDANHYDTSTSTAAQHWDGGHYDKTDRNGPKIFVGEWATREGAPTPNMGAALGDAAWMTGLERNSDLVIMASYAPMLVNVNPGGLQWDTDLIGYNALSSYGSPAYYAQVLFAKYLGDHTLASKVEGAGPRFFYSVTADAAKKRVYLKLVNADSDPQTITVDLPGAKFAATAKVETLHAATTQATNSITAPTIVVPVASELHGVSNHLHTTLPPYTIQVIEFEEQ
jgi:alpha-N-arabinofuranosidase